MQRRERSEIVADARSHPAHKRALAGLSRSRGDRSSMFSSGSGMKGLENQLLCANTPDASALRPKPPSHAPCARSRSQLKFTAKQLNRLSKKCEKEEKAEKDKIKKSLEKDNHDGARIHAQNAIRNKSNAQNYLRLSSRVDAVSSRLESAIKMQQVTKSMGSVVKGMDKVLKSMNVEAISRVKDRTAHMVHYPHRAPPTRRTADPVHPVWRR